MNVPSMATTAQQPLLLIEEAMEGFREPNRFDEGEAVIACLRGCFGLLFMPAYIDAVDCYRVRLRSVDGRIVYSLPQYDVLKLAAVESSQAL